MAKDPADFVEVMLREIQTTLSEQKRGFEILRADVEEMKASFETLHETVYTATGFTVHAHAKADSISEKFDELEKRITKLEEQA